MTMLALTLPSTLSEPSLNATAVILLSVAAGLSLIKPVGAGIVTGFALMLPLLSDSTFLGGAAFASPLSIAGCTARGKLRAAIILGFWHIVVLLGATVGDHQMGISRRAITDTVAWLALLLIAGAVGAWIRHLIGRIAAERTQRVLDLAEQRRILARELHDTAVRATTEVVLFAENAAHRPGVDPGSAQEFARISRTARMTTDELRRLMTALRDTEQSHEDLDPAPLLVATWQDVLDNARDRLISDGFDVRVSSEGDVPVPPQILHILSRCLDEVRANVVRHGDRETPVAIMSQIAGGETLGEVSVDLVVLNGVSEQPHLADLRGGAGLDGVRERLAPLHGTLETDRDGSMFLTHISVPTQSPSPTEAR